MKMFKNVKIASAVLALLAVDALIAAGILKIFSLLIGFSFHWRYVVAYYFLRVVLALFFKKK